MKTTRTHTLMTATFNRALLGHISDVQTQQAMRTVMV